VAGAARYICADEAAPDAMEGDFFLLRPGMRRLQIREALRLAYIPFSLRDGKTEYAPLDSAPIHRFSGTRHDRNVLENAFLDARRELVQTPQSARAALQVRLMLLVFAESGSGAQAARPSVPAAILESALHLATHPEERIRVPDMAATAGFSTSQFTRLFRKAYGTSPARYAIQARIRAACRLLTAEGLSVKEAAFALNYPSPFAFSRQFRAERGHPPSEYARQSGQCE